MNKPSHNTVESLLSQVDDLTATSDQKFELWVSQSLSLRGQPIRLDVAMAIIGDKILSRGYEPDGFMEGKDGRTYKYKIIS